MGPITRAARAGPWLGVHQANPESSEVSEATSSPDNRNDRDHLSMFEVTEFLMIGFLATPSSIIDPIIQKYTQFK